MTIRIIAGKIFFSVQIILLTLKIQAQELKEFSSDSLLFINQFEEFVNKNINESDKTNLDVFVEKWKTRGFDKAIETRITEVCNFLLKNKAQRNPHFTKYLETVLAFHSNDKAMKNYDEWEKGISFIITNEKSPLGKLNSYLDNTLGLIKDSIIYKSYATTWFVSSGDFKIETGKTVRILFNKTDITCKIKNDSINIYNTQGIYYPITNTWKGEKGKVNWIQAGYPVENVFADLNKYTIDLTKSGYQADSASFTNTIYFDKPILGKLEDQVVHNMGSDKAIYPEFNSYQKRFQIKEIYPDIDYDGGFSMKGANLIGSGIKNQEAFLFIKKEGKKIMTARSETFLFKKDKVISNSAQVTLKLENDSIFHPGIMFTYEVKNNEITLNPNDRIVSESPFFDSYHNIFMKFDRLMWQTNTNKMYLTSARGSSIGNATFTSANFYNLVDYESIQARDNQHPLYLIKTFARMKKSEQFKADEFANYMGYPVHQVRQMLMFISRDGFIFYDFDNDLVTINQRLYDYINSRLGKIDYDVIKFYSQTEGLTHNGVYDISTSELEINGVPRIFLSDSQNVVISPKNQKIVMKKNRSFSFGGVINAGLFTFYGDVFHFDYDTFKINLNNVDSLNIKVQTSGYDLYGKSVLTAVQNTIKLVTGNLLIDDPKNKSGLKSYPQYPIFISSENSFVYYNSHNIQGGVYKQENFYFKLDPFVIDSLDNFKTKNLYFNGEFFSANIFPPFEDSIYLRQDYSLGFNRLTPPEGFPLYQGKGTYFNEIDLSNRGLRGNGTLEYLTSTSNSDDIIFFPDSTKIHAKDFSIAQVTTGIEFPNVSSSEIDIKWYPYKDVMLVEQTKDPFTLFNQNIKLSGSLKLQPTGLSGKGTIDMDKAILSSKLFNFDALKFNSDTTNFKLKSIDKADFNFISSNLKAKVDLASQTGKFETNDNYSVSEFPKNLYQCYLDQFQWKINVDEIHIDSNPLTDTISYPVVDQLAKLKDDKLPGALFLSVHRSQDSLRFSSTKAVYKLADSTINASEVKYIRVADASVYPKNGKVTVGNLAEMNTLVDSKVEANNQTKYHTIYDSKINIRGRYNYMGSGEIDYIDEIKTKQTIHLTDIHVDSTRQTFAVGKILSEDAFTLSPVYKFNGNVELYASKKYLTFKGGVSIEHECPKIGNDFAYFESEINPDTIYIPISNNLRNLIRRELFAGSFITKDSSHIYSSFLTRRRDPNDEAIVKATGYLFYNKNSRKYIIAEKSKILNPDTTGSLVNLNKDFCLLHGEGIINPGIELGQVKMSPAGSFNHDLDKNEIKLELILPLDFFFSDAALDSLSSDLQSQKLESFNITSPFFEKNMNERYGKDNTTEFKNQNMLFASEAKIPKDIQHTILLGNIKLKWFTETGSYLSYGKIGISTINNKPVNKYVEGYFQLLKRRSGDLLKFYIKLPNNNYYYFTYSRGVMQTLSNNKKFVDAIQAIKNKNRKLSTPRNETPYRYIIATEQNMQQFLRDIRLFEEAQNIKTNEQEKTTIEQPVFEEPIDSIQINDDLENDSTDTN
ncbi:MAG: hypothetical protein A2X13_03970 [Bacteroidetes bacterium GWC2_33_15]|nr:MAG: hypothetical protein A2X10_00735 [Bacteroidetes bacterium GWA2_33_15]OFX49680.1 MAG: hypothetical protein A2X13_03970 [Bacteroidetes bacterium GWC2_33_15]OFX65930.1 MAG: hypothetical protein A2X15_10865 [Bacteroidetes bacterium GWB2_32_14]OFX68309.1 MAG: hypothetical protein A2X14_08030 [Bacteroidetes bacterium GWD2_33_33]HAN18093.1 hypothetical protein [Bacteroidales bacterium]